MNILFLRVLFLTYYKDNNDYNIDELSKDLDTFESYVSEHVDMDASIHNINTQIYNISNNISNNISFKPGKTN